MCSDLFTCNWHFYPASTTICSCIITLAPHDRLWIRGCGDAKTRINNNLPRILVFTSISTACQLWDCGAVWMTDKQGWELAEQAPARWSPKVALALEVWTLIGGNNERPGTNSERYLSCALVCSFMYFMSAMNRFSWIHAARCLRTRNNVDWSESSFPVPAPHLCTRNTVNQIALSSYSVQRACILWWEGCWLFDQRPFNWSANCYALFLLRSTGSCWKEWAKSRKCQTRKPMILIMVREAFHMEDTIARTFICG